MTEAFFGIEASSPPLVGLRVTPETIAAALARAVKELSKPYIPSPCIVGPQTFKQWQDSGIIVESPPGSGNWKFA